ncbi:Kelch repeat-containing protein [Sorangium sp. So ce341]|uniref:Kelch repeat-containing protein n=1 Tax=Sorangium sp. So ce341 TaxID=3133302 RepID=UPI003F5F2CF0
MDRSFQESSRRRGRPPCPRVARPCGGSGVALLTLAALGVAWLSGCAQAGVDGGDRSAEPLRQVRLADATPSAPTWISAASLSVPRALHTATRLLDGRVLVTGGQVDSEGPPLASAEIYDPATGAWTPAASMGAARSSHGAALLSNGKVFVYGGNGGDFGEPLGTAEIYDPAADRWIAVAPAPAPRFAYAATPLLDGRILVSGGRAAPHGPRSSPAARSTIRRSTHGEMRGP